MYYAIFNRVIGRFWWACHSFCLLTTHVHLFLQTQDGSLSSGMQRLNSEYAQSFNRRHGSVGHLFQDRFFSVIVETDSHAMDVVRYIAQNPVEAGLCRSPEDWLWSSHGHALGYRRSPGFLTSSWVLGLFDDDLEVARRRLRAFVARAEPFTGSDPLKGRRER